MGEELSLRFGPRLISDSETEFRIWAPSVESVALIVEGQSARAMERQEGGWFRIRAPFGAGTRYRFQVTEDLLVPDPASRFQPEGVHGTSMVVDSDDYGWICREWRGRPWREAVVYEAHVGVLGGFDGVRALLPELAALGVTAIELMPLSAFGGERNWGYDGVLPYAVPNAYGTPAQLKALIDAAHEVGLMVLLDVVYNHFGPDGNYLGVYADAFFDDERSSPWGRGIAFQNPDVAAYFHENVLYWMTEFRADGVRIDAAWAIPERQWFMDLRRRIDAVIEPGRHFHLVLENENNDAGLLRSGFDAQWNDDFHNVLHVLLTKEHEGYYGNFSDDPIAGVATCLRDGFLYQGQIAPDTGKPRGQESGDLSPTHFVNFLQNHDQIGNRAFGERLVSLGDPGAVRVAYALLLLTPFIPMIFMGDEWGSRTPFLFFTDYHDELADQVREGRRKEFAKFSAFHDPKKREKIADPNALSTFEASRPDRRERDSGPGQEWLALTRELLAIRREKIVPVLDGASSLGTVVLGDEALQAAWKLGDGSVLTVLVNFGAEDVFCEPHDTDSVIFAFKPLSGDSLLTARNIIVSLEGQS